jgi:hypothetical protein
MYIYQVISFNSQIIFLPGKMAEEVGINSHHIIDTI